MGRTQVYLSIELSRMLKQLEEVMPEYSRSQIIRIAIEKLYHEKLGSCSEKKLLEKLRNVKGNNRKELFKQLAETLSDCFPTLSQALKKLANSP